VGLQSLAEEKRKQKKICMNRADAEYYLHIDRETPLEAAARIELPRL
jgi:hypothetical protein